MQASNFTLMIIAYACMMGAAFGLIITSTDGKGESLVNKNGRAYMSSEGKPVDFKVEEIVAGGEIFTDKSTGKVLDIEGGRTNLIFYSNHKGANQRFGVVADGAGGYYIKNSNKCLERGTEGNMYLATCSSKPQQKFALVYSPDDPGYKPPVEVPVPAEAPAPAAPNPSPQILIFNGGRKKHLHVRNPHDESSSASDEGSRFSSNSGLIV
ncbi:hypothetical protein KMI_01g02380 [Encephalitozoon hellem]|nr:hypothetical protein KMI_01g02380 [Encephalitozoon hellem]